MASVLVLVTWPAADPAASRTTEPSVGTLPLATLKPTSTVSLARATRVDSAARPMKCVGLSSFTAQETPAAKGVDSESVSWPTMMWRFSRRSTRWASRPTGRMPASAPAGMAGL